MFVALLRAKTIRYWDLSLQASKNQRLSSLPKCKPCQLEANQRVEGRHVLSHLLSTFMFYPAAVAVAQAKSSSLHSVLQKLRSSRQILTHSLCCSRWATKKMTQKLLCKSHRTIWNKPVRSCSTIQILPSRLDIKSHSLQTTPNPSRKLLLHRPQPAVAVWSTSMRPGSPPRHPSVPRRSLKTSRDSRPP